MDWDDIEESWQDAQIEEAYPWIEIRPGVLRRMVIGKRWSARLNRWVNLAYQQKWRCQDCHGVEDLDFMVGKELWEEIMKPKDLQKQGGFICRHCFSKRLGRPLALKDLTEAPINHPLREKL